MELDEIMKDAAQKNLNTGRFMPEQKATQIVYLVHINTRRRVPY